MIETWCKCLDQNKVLIGLSKAFDCLPHDLLVAKLEAYDLDTRALKLMLSYPQASYGKGPDYFRLKTAVFPVSVFLLLFSMKFGIELENYQYDSFK